VKGAEDQFVTTDLSTLLTALYVKIDDWLGHPPRPGHPPMLSEAELLTLAVAQALLGIRSEARWLRFVPAHLPGAFPYLPGQSGYIKRLRAALPLLRRATRDDWAASRQTASHVRLPAGGRDASELSPAVVTASRRHLTSRYATGVDSFLWETDQIPLPDRAAIQAVVLAARAGRTGLSQDLVAALVLIQVVRRELEAEETELHAAAGHAGLSRETLAVVSG
jgi:hypothetical protein